MGLSQAEGSRVWAHSKEIQQSGFHTLLVGSKVLSRGQEAYVHAKAAWDFTMQLQGWHLASLVWFLIGDRGSC